MTTARGAFLKALDLPSIEQAIRRAEAHTSGEIRLSIAGYFRGDPHRLATRAFHRLRMNATHHRNGVLILIAPARRQVVVLGDQGIHARVGDAFWRDTAALLTGLLREGEPNRAVLRAIETVGDELARHFPLDAAANPNELPDAIDLSPG
ncbi:MAG TPA: TPM domain-containing protein [Polyangia bacterium]